MRTWRALCTLLLVLGCEAQAGSRRACAPGGACSRSAASEIAAASAELRLPRSDLSGSAAEVRIWTLDVSLRHGSLTRMIADSLGTRADRFRWWSAKPLSAEQRLETSSIDSASCMDLWTASDRVFCRLRPVGRQYAMSAWQVLERHGIWSLPGSDAPADTVRCYFDWCELPARLVVETRDSTGYRTYGYPLPARETERSDPAAAAIAANVHALDLGP